jgi:LysR family glycine cleavage system transcriptional activator
MSAQPKAVQARYAANANKSRPARPVSMRGIRTFCAAARHQSFKLAADDLYITASAVSHQVKKLEGELRVALFDRNGRVISLTAAGDLLFREASAALASVDEVVGRLRGEYLRSSLRVSVQPFFASEFFVPHLSEFTGSNPGIDIHVDTSDEASERHPVAADVSIRLFRQVPAGLAATMLFPLRLVPACSAGFRKRLDIVGWRVKSALPMVVHSSRPNAWKAWSEHSGIAVPETSNYIRLDSMLAVARAAEQGLGAALVPLPLAAEWFASGRLVRLFDYELVMRDAYYIVCAEEDSNRPDIAALRNWILQSFAITK